MIGELKNASELWSMALAELRKDIDEVAYRQFIEPMVPLHVNEEEAVFTVGVSDDFLAAWLTNSYADEIASCISTVAGKVMKVSFTSGYTEEEKSAEEEKNTLSVPVSSGGSVQSASSPKSEKKGKRKQKVCR